MELGNMGLKYRVSLAIIAILLVISLFVSSSYAFWKVTEEQSTANTLGTSCFKLTFEDSSSKSINLTNTYPMVDASGLKTTPYTFKLTNNCENALKYTVYLNTLTPTATAIPDAKIKYTLKKDSGTEKASLLGSATKNQDKSSFSTSSSIVTSYKLDTAGGTSTPATGTLAKGASVTYSLKLWIDSTAGNEVEGKAFNAEVAVTAYDTVSNK